MEFEFTSSVWIEEADLKEMLTLINEKGYDYNTAFHEVALGWDDEEYYDAEYVKDSVIEELKKRNI